MKGFFYVICIFLHFLFFLLLYFCRNILSEGTVIVVGGILVISLFIFDAEYSYYRKVLSQPLVSLKAILMKKEEYNGEGYCSYTLYLKTIDKKELRLKASEEQYKMLKKNDIVFIRYQGYVLYSFRRKKDKLPIINKKYTFSEEFESNEK